MSKIEVPEGMDDERAEKLLEQRAKARSGSRQSKDATRNKAGGSDTSVGEIAFWSVVIGSLVLGVRLGFSGF